MALPELPKLMTRVRFPLSAPFLIFSTHQILKTAVKHYGFFHALGIDNIKIGFRVSMATLYH
ncbi:hypothetical protein PMSV_2927 [Photobacterium leiognathi subsp. mandapamensis svers.1.1.]|nr:hypothetical protein PMSV_2927 [Photobacterium leiognathi subsp. mandapamensis svers.1.1.]